MIRSMHDLFFVKGGAHFNIPDYQRGYEWSKEEVTQLLDDLKTFKEKKEKEDSKSFYCLQHITVFKTTDGSYNVVDGQQRLTTLAIILSYFEQGGMFETQLSYSVREKTGDLLKKKIFSREYWKGNERPDDDGPKDWYYIMDAADAVREWAVEKVNDKDGFLKTLLHDAKLLFNEIDKAGDIEEKLVFANINGAKADLDGADLLRALLITRAAREQHGAMERVNERRVRMGMELDAINAWCAQDDVKAYLRLLLPDAKKRDTGFDTDKYPIGFLYQMIYETEKETQKDEEQHFDFRFFEYGLDISKNGPGDDNIELYEELCKMYALARDWYSDKIIFHYTAYLFARFKKADLFKEVYAKWDNRETFRIYLKAQIAEQLCKDWDREQADQAANAKALIEAIKDVNKNWYGSTHLPQLLILLDVIACTASGSVRRLAVKQFKPLYEDEEHIACQTPNEKDRKDKNKLEVYISEVETYLNDIHTNNDHHEQITALIDKVRTLPEGEERNTAVERLADMLHRIGLGSIGNLVLLDQSINRGYGNASFPEKKVQILTGYFAGKSAKGREVLIRPHTLNVFASEKDSMWTFGDIQKNADEIAEKISQFLNVK